MPLRDLILTISVPFLWGIGFVLTKPGMEQFPPMLINSLRWGLTGLKERPSKKNIFGIFVAFIGIVILSGAPNLQGKTMGVILVLSGAFTWSLGQVIAKPVSEKLNGIILTAWLGILSAPQLLIASHLIEGNVIRNILSADYKAWLIVLYLGMTMFFI